MSRQQQQPGRMCSPTRSLPGTPQPSRTFASVPPPATPKQPIPWRTMCLLLAWLASLMPVNLDSLFPVRSVGPSLLTYFPKLTTLSTWNSTSSFVFPAAKIKEDIARFSPRLTEPILSNHFGTLVPNFCSHVSIKLSMITFLFDRLSTRDIMAFLLHQATLKRIYAFQESGFDFEQHAFPPLSTHLHESSRFLQLIPRCCQRLEVLSLYLPEMNMDEIEMGEWACKDLKVFRIRIKDLDTKDKVLGTIALWRAGCREQWQGNASEDVTMIMTVNETNISIEDRVARHLLKFEKLSRVWLGY